MFRRIPLLALSLMLLALAITGCGGGDSGTDPDFVAPYSNVDAPVRLAFLVQPNRGAGVPFNNIQVGVINHKGEVVPTATNAITIAIDNNPGGATLGGTTTQNAAAGMATFGDLTLDRPGAGYTFRATSPGLVDAVSAPFTVTAGPPASLRFRTQPSNVTIPNVIAPAVEVEVLDGLGNLVTNTNVVTIVIGNNPGGGTLAGNVSLQTVGGVATFANLGVSQAGTGYTLVAAITGVQATSDPFDVNAVLTNGSFESGDYTGWTLLQTPIGLFTTINISQGIATNGQVINPLEMAFDFFDQVLETNSQGPGHPITYVSTQGNFVQYVVQHNPSRARMYQDVTLPGNATQIAWDMRFVNWWLDWIVAGPDPNFQYIAVHLRDVNTDAILATVYQTMPGDNRVQVNMAPFTADISAFAGQTVRIDFEVYSGISYLDVSTDNWRIQ